MKTVKIFLGGGVTLLEGDETMVGYRPSVVDPAISKLNSRSNSDRFYVVKTFDDLKHESTREGHQEHYNRWVENEADIALFILDGALGGQTKSEINHACSCHHKHGHPSVYFYGTNLSDKDDIVEYLNEKKQYFQHFSSKVQLNHRIQNDLSLWNRNSSHNFDEKIKFLLNKIRNSKIAMILTMILLVLLAWIGYSCYNSYLTKKNRERIDYIHRVINDEYTRFKSHAKPNDFSPVMRELYFSIDSNFIAAKSLCFPPPKDFDDNFYTKKSVVEYRQIYEDFRLRASRINATFVDILYSKQYSELLDSSAVDIVMLSNIRLIEKDLKMITIENIQSEKNVAQIEKSLTKKLIAYHNKKYKTKKDLVNVYKLVYSSYYDADYWENFEKILLGEVAYYESLYKYDELIRDYSIRL